jgi:Lrp/AsnC family leucine-responsive transcriptional regulator
MTKQGKKSRQSNTSRSVALRTPKKIRLDDTDLLILSMLQGDARVSNVDIARRAKMVPSGILERVRKLERSGIIAGYEARLDSGSLGFALLAFIFVKVDHRIGPADVAAKLAAIPEVQEIHNIAGEDCYLLKVRAGNPTDLGGILRDKIASIKCVISTRTTIVLDTVKETSAIPLQTSKRK